MSTDDAARDSAPPAVPGDAKDWTWVLERTCPECRYDVRDFDRTSTGRLLREIAARWREVLAADPEEVRRRPEPQTWSPLEYACHVRDVCELYSERLTLMITEDGPHYPNWDQDATAIEQRYDLADPPTVASELGEQAERLAAQFDRIADDDWDRTGFRSDGAAFTVETFARYFVHDPVHHLHDVGVDFGGSVNG